MLLVDNEILHSRVPLQDESRTISKRTISDNQLTGIGPGQDILGVGGGVLVLVGDALGVVDDVLGDGSIEKFFALLRKCSVELILSQI